MKFDVTFEASGFTNHPSILDSEFSEEEARGFTETARAENTLPKGVCAVKSGYISSDDNQGKADIHVFVGVVLTIEAETEGAAERCAPPEDLLTRIADLIGSEEGECKLDIEAHSWELTDVSKVQTEVVHANSESTHYLQAMGWMFLCNGHGDARLTGGVWLYKGDQAEAKAMQEARWQAIKRQSDGYYAQQHV